MARATDPDEQDVSDSWITVKVKSDLLKERGIPASDIKVETEHGAVSLSSPVTLTEIKKEQAVSIVKRAKGVKSINADGLKAE